VGVMMCRQALLAEALHQLARDCELVAGLLVADAPPGHVHHARAKLLRDEAEMRIKRWARDVDEQIVELCFVSCVENLDALKGEK
jgi:hypothetical protein